MKNKFWLLALLFSITLFRANAQEFTVPKNYVLSTAEDYARYEKDILACTLWLENTPLDKETDKRKQANVFFTKWITGTSAVSISLSADKVLKYTEANPDLLIVFMAGWTRFALENNYSKNEQKGYLAGYTSIIHVYKTGVGIKKSKDMDKLVKLYDKGELEKWVSEKIK